MTAPQSFTVSVVGVPAPQGSKRAVGRGVMIESSKKVGPWREAVAWTTRAAIPRGWDPTGPMQVHVTFFMPRPRSRRKTEVWADRQPDLDKLLRSTFDALTTAGVWGDDAQVCSVTSRKVLADPSDPWTGAHIEIRRLP